MISRPKQILNKSKSIDKIKVTKESAKTRNQNAHKLQSCPSKKVIKTKVKQEENVITMQNDQNFNKINMQTFKKANSCNQVASLQIKRSASAGVIKIVKQKIGNNLSPYTQRQSRDKTDRHKYSSKPSVKSEKLKKIQLNQQKTKVSLNKKSDLKTDRYIEIGKKAKNEQSKIKTVNYINLQQNKQHKKQKISTKKVQSKKDKSKNKIQKLKQKIMNSILYQNTQSNESPAYSAIMSKENFNIRVSKQQQIYDHLVSEAAIIIQKHFRGFLTRKYIQELKVQIYSVIKIQKVWRGYICRKKLSKNMNKRQLSIENSLITIKDFNSEPKQEFYKTKSFRFDSKDKTFDDGSNLKKNRSEDEQKYLKILESLLGEEGLEQKFKQKIRTTLGKQNYVKSKIVSEIVSQKYFNSPKQTKTPKSKTPKSILLLSSPSSWSKNRQSQTQFYSSPCNYLQNIENQQSFFKRLSSPPQKCMKRSIKKLIMDQKSENNCQMVQKIQKISTNFAFIQEFQFKIVDFLREHDDQKKQFCEKCKKSQAFKTNILLLQWNVNKFENQPQITEPIPQYFSQQLRKTILSWPPISNYLQQNNFNHSSLTQKLLNQCFIECIFDGFSQAIYLNYFSILLTQNRRSFISRLQNFELFKAILCNSLSSMQNWCEFYCGAQIPVDQDDQNYQKYVEKSIQKFQTLAKDSCMTGWTTVEDKQFQVKLDIQEFIFQTLLLQLFQQFSI